MSEEIKEILEHIKTYPEKLYCLSEKEKRILLDYITILQQKVEQLEKENKELNRMCELYGQSLYNADLTKAEKKVEQLENIRKEAIDCLNNFSVDKSFSFPLMKRWEENQVKASIDYEFNNSLKKDLLNILNKGSDKE